MRNLPLTVREVKVMHMPPKPFIAKAKKIRMDRSEGEREGAVGLLTQASADTSRPID